MQRMKRHVAWYWLATLLFVGGMLDGTAESRAQCQGKFCPQRVAGIIGIVGELSGGQTLIIYYGVYCSDSVRPQPSFLVAPFWLDTTGNCSDCAKCVQIETRARARQQTNAVRKPDGMPTIWHRDLQQGTAGYFGAAQDASAGDDFAVQSQTVNVKVIRQSQMESVHTFKLVKVYTTPSAATAEFMAFEVPTQNPNQVDHTATSVPDGAYTFEFEAPPVGGGANVAYQAILVSQQSAARQRK